MAIRIQKTKKIGPVRVNMSKSGIGISTGIKGARIGVGPSGVRKTVGIPGTGIRYESRSGFMKESSQKINSNSLANTKKSMKRSTRLVISLLCLFSFVFSVGIMIDDGLSFGYIFLSILFISIFYINAREILKIKVSDTPLPETKQQVTSIDTENKTQAVPKQEQVIKCPSEIDGKSRAYSYKDVNIFPVDPRIFDWDALSLGAMLSVDHDDENEYDSNAISLSLNEYIIGYLYKGKLQDMANDWVKRGEPIQARISLIDRTNKKIQICLAFYRDKLFTRLQRSYPNAKAYKLVGNTNEEMQDSISLCSEGEEVVIDYDYEKSKYLVFNHSTIGYLPATAVAYMDKNGGMESCSFFTTDPDYLENGKINVGIYIFPNE